MEWLETTARTVDEAKSKALDLLGVDDSDAEVQVLEEGKTGLFGRTKTEARVRARIKPKAPPVKDDRRNGRNDNRRRSSNRSGDNRPRKNDNQKRKQGSGSGNSQGGSDKNRSKSNNNNQNASNSDSDGNGQTRRRRRSRNGSGSAGAGAVSGGSKGQGKDMNSDRQRSDDRPEVPIEEQRSVLTDFITGVAQSFDSSAEVELVEEGTTLTASVTGENMGFLIGSKAQTLQALEELSRTAMHRAAGGRRYHRIQVDVDGYKARRTDALKRFAVSVAEQVADTGVSKAIEPMGAADRKLVHDAVAEVAGVETASEGRDPRRYIVIHSLTPRDEEE